MKTTLLIFFLFAQLLLLAQKKPTSAEINKARQMQADAQKQMEKDLKELEATDPEQAKMIKEMMKKGVSPTMIESGMASEDKLPVKNTKALASIPTTVFTKETIRPFLNDINSKLISQLPTTDLANINRIKDSVKNNALWISRSAVSAWYRNSPLTALALASTAANLDGSNAEILNSLSAILNLSGYEKKAIPILKFLLTQVPGNSTVLNNLGQAYLGLGDQQMAEKYLLQAVASSKKHVEANRSLARIYRSQGQQTKARSCIQKSLEGGHSSSSVELARELGMSDESIDELIINPVKSIKAPTYFNNYKYQLPPMCENVGKAKEVATKHKEFQQFLENEIKKYSTLIEEEEVKIMKAANDIAAPARRGEIVSLSPSPMFEKAIRMFNYWLMKFNEFAMTMHEPYVKLKMEEHKLDEEYHVEYVRINTRNDNKDHCPDFDALANRFLPLYAMNQRNLIDMHLTAYRGYMDELMYWSQYMNLVKEGKARVYGLIQAHLQHLLGISRDTKIIFPACAPSDIGEISPKEAETIEPDCPFDIKINLIIGDIAMDCTKFAIEMNAGISFSAEKDFTTKETTLAIGVGLGISKGLELPVIGIEAGASVSEQFYIVFDGNNKPSDIGIKFEAGVKIEAGGSVGPLSTDIGDISAGGGYTLGLNSGWNFSGSVPGIKGNLFN